VYFLLVSIVIGGGAEYLMGFLISAGSEGVTPCQNRCYGTRIQPAIRSKLPFIPNLHSPFL